METITIGVQLQDPSFARYTDCFVTFGLRLGCHDGLGGFSIHPCLGCPKNYADVLGLEKS